MPKANEETADRMNEVVWGYVKRGYIAKWNPDGGGITVIDPNRYTKAKFPREQSDT